MKKNEINNISMDKSFVQKIELAICERYQSVDIPSDFDESINMFGRSVLLTKTDDVDNTIGVSITGLRTAIKLSQEGLLSNIIQLSNAVRKHLAMVIHASNCSHPEYHIVSKSGCVQLFASNAQEEIDFTLIARRISELALIPTICASDSYEINNGSIPDKGIIIKYLGAPDELMECPTPAQKIIFGKKRRRTPNWFDLNFPSANSMKKEKELEKFEIAAKQEFIYSHLSDLMTQAFDEYNELLGTKYSCLGTHQSTDAEYLILTQGSAYNVVTKVVDEVRQQGVKVGCVNLSVLVPFPEKELMSVVNGKRSITILENISGSVTGNTHLCDKIASILYGANIQVNIISGLFFDVLNSSDVNSVINNISGENKQKFYLGVDFLKSSTQFPKHEILIGNIKREYPDLIDVSFNTKVEREGKPEEKIELDLPYTIRQYKDDGPAYTKLSRFYDNVSLFFNNGFLDELIADPFQAIPFTPASTANFINFSKYRDQVPLFIPDNCSGCGNCFVNCPHSALPPISIGIPELIKSGAEIASKKGAEITKIIPIIKTLAKVIADVVDKNEDASLTLIDFMQIGFDRFSEQAGLKDDKLTPIRADFKEIVDAISLLPIAVTDSFFKQQNLLEKGRGEFFSLAVDPLACTACGVCVSSCSNGALIMQDQTNEVLSDLQNKFKLWESLPDTSSETIKRLHKTEGYNPFAAIMLSRNYYMSMSGGTKGSECEPSKQLLHLVTSLLESVLQPSSIKWVKLIDDYITKLNNDIHSILSNNLPVKDFSNLEKALKKSKGSMTPFNEIIQEIGDNELMKQIDTAALQRKIDLCNSLKDLKWVLIDGPTGCGRSRFSMVINSIGTLRWTNDFPSNVFSFPVIINSNDTSSGDIIGIFNGYLRYIIDNIKLIRRADLEVKNKYDNDLHGEEIANLKWQDFSEQEKKNVPPLVLVIDSNRLNNTTELFNLLSSDYPIKIIMIDDASFSPRKEDLNKIREKTSLITTAITLKNAFVFQGAIGAPNHLFNGLHKGMLSSKPALFSLYSNENNSHQENSDYWNNLSSLAFSSRAMPLIKYDPSIESMFMCSCFDLNSNPSPHKLWHSEKIVYTNNDEEKEIEYTITWADWAFELLEWKEHFQQCDNNEGISVSEYISLDKKNRLNKEPVIIRSKAGSLIYYKVSEKVIVATEMASVVWETWRELAGTITEFPDKLMASVRSDLSIEYKEKIDKIKSEYEHKLLEQERNQVDNMRVILREKLTLLSTKIKN